MGRNPPKGLNPENYKLELSYESFLSCRAVQELFKNFTIDKIVFLAGKTAGKKWPSEGACMKNWVQKFGHYIPEEKFIVMENSVDTFNDIENARVILEKERPKYPVAVLTMGYHLPRVKKIFKNFGVDVYGFSSERVLMDIYPFSFSMDNYLNSIFWKRQELKEFFLRLLLKFDRNGKILIIFTKRLRNNNR